ncbi:MAG: hypothetical protein AAGI23_23155 [Bacteroidota bacterium]
MKSLYYCLFLFLFIGCQAPPTVTQQLLEKWDASQHPHLNLFDFQTIDELDDFQ